ncbi:alcohol dehydrogenase catalytic domain-containing protein [Rubrivivax rivuli]|uniref:Histidine kinase n=1 Tax=Rubrivivax rivuli TaxID=1862385 RepID=A0A437R8E0_9BURK|nr:alcohol dehydrogenase catalytic domain-containing protein [Rubrivivax rivuli]RVU43038.1 histidine kinase [Rubrivivax rivuli]
MAVRDLQGLAALGNGRGGFAIEPVVVRAPAAGEVRVRLTAAGLCHTDHASLHWPGPLVLGHEGAGVVESVGPGVTHLEPGAPVLLNWAIPCGRCPQCQRGRGSLCERTHGVDATLGSSAPAPGHTLWRGQPVERSFRLGTFSEYTVVRAEALSALPAQLPARHACILGCGVMTGVGAALNVAQVQPGDTVAVVGCGGVGLSVVQGARLAGAGRIIAIDRRPTALQRAVAFGATHTLEPPPEDAQGDQLAAAVRALTEGRGADHAFEATGVAALAFLPLKLCRNGGNAVQLSGAHGPVSVEMPQFWWDKRYLVPLYGGCLPERDFPRLFDWAARGALQLESLVTHTYRLDELGQALDDMLAGRSAKGVILFD